MRVLFSKKMNVLLWFVMLSATNSPCAMGDEAEVTAGGEVQEGEMDTEGEMDDIPSDTDVEEGEMDESFMQQEAPALRPIECASYQENCGFAGCCKDPKHTCYKKNDFHWGCRETGTCTPGTPSPFDNDPLASPWKCSKWGEGICGDINNKLFQHEMQDMTTNSWQPAYRWKDMGLGCDAGTEQVIDNEEECGSATALMTPDIASYEKLKLKGRFHSSLQPIPKWSWQNDGPKCYTKYHESLDGKYHEKHTIEGFYNDKIDPSKKTMNEEGSIRRSVCHLDKVAKFGRHMYIWKNAHEGNGCSGDGERALTDPVLCESVILGFLAFDGGAQSHNLRSEGRFFDSKRNPEKEEWKKRALSACYTTAENYIPSEKKQQTVQAAADGGDGGAADGGEDGVNAAGALTPPMDNHISGYFNYDYTFGFYDYTPGDLVSSNRRAICQLIFPSKAISLVARVDQTISYWANEIKNGRITCGNPAHKKLIRDEGHTYTAELKNVKKNVKNLSQIPGFARGEKVNGAEKIIKLLNRCKDGELRRAGAQLRGAQFMHDFERKFRDLQKQFKNNRGNDFAKPCDQARKVAEKTKADFVREVGPGDHKCLVKEQVSGKLVKVEQMMEMVTNIGKECKPDLVPAFTNYEPFLGFL